MKDHSELLATARRLATDPGYDLLLSVRRTLVALADVVEAYDKADSERLTWLRHLAEYWNGNTNARAMADALDHILAEVQAAIEEYAVDEIAPTAPDITAELVENARMLAMRIDTTIIRGELDNHVELMQEISPILRVLGNTIAAYDRADSECAAACQTCDEVITALIEDDRRLADSPERVSIDWAKLRAARHLAQVAVANHEKAKGGA